MTLLNYTWNFSALLSQPEDFNKVQTSFNEIKAVINNLDATNITDGSLGDAEIAAGASIALSKLAIPPMARVFHNADQAVAGSGGPATVIAFNSERYDTATLHDNVTNNSRLTAPVAGVYRIGFNGIHDPTNLGEAAAYRLRLNGATMIAETEAPAASINGPAPIPPLVTEYLLAATDYVEVVELGLTANGGTLKATGNSSPEFWMSFVSRAV